MGEAGKELAHHLAPGSVAVPFGDTEWGPRPLRGHLLIITRLDCRKEPNQRVHHQIRHLAPSFSKTTVLHRARGTPDVSWRGHARSMLTLRATTWRQGSVSFVEVDPFWNPPWGSRLRYVHFLGFFLFEHLSLLLGYLLRARQAYDVVLAVGPTAGVLGCLLRRVGLARLLVYDDIDCEAGLEVRRYRARCVSWMERFFMAQADLRVTVGDFLAELRQSQGVGELIVIPNGVDFKRFATAQEKACHPPTLIYTGNIARSYSGLDVAIRALRKIAGSCPDVRFLIVGGGDPREAAALRSLIRSLGVEDSIHLVGECRYEELPGYLQQADLGWAVFPPNDGRRYAFPCKVIEYMAAGVAVLGSPDSQTARVIQRYGCGIVTPCDVDAAADAVVGLLADRQRLTEYGDNGARAAAGFDWSDLMARQRALILSRLEG